MPFKVGANPIITSIQYLEAGKIYLKDRIKILTVYFSYKKELDNHHGTKDFAEFYLPQIQYKNPNVQILKLRDMTPTPFIRCFLDSGDDIIIDTDNKSKHEIADHVLKVLGKTESEIEAMKESADWQESPANFGYLCKNACICHVLGQVPCPSIVPVPVHWRGKLPKIPGVL